MLVRKGLKHSLECCRGDPPGRPYNPTERVILHLDLDAFFAQVEERANLKLAGKPIFVIGHSLTSGVVLTANYEARKYGIKTGMPLREARRLCPFAVLVPADCSKYADTSERIFQHLSHYTPLVEVFSIDEAFMDVTGTHRFWGGPARQPHDVALTQSSDLGGPEKIAQEIKAWVRRHFDLTLSIGIGPNKLLAKLATGQMKPDGLFRIHPQEVERTLKNLPVEELCGIGERLKRHLNRMGIRTCGDLGNFSEGILLERFGILGLILKRMGQGIDHSPVLPIDHFEEAKSVGHSYTLTQPIRDRKAAWKYLRWLSEKVARRLRKGHYEGRCVHAILRFSDFETVAKQRNLPFYLDDGQLIDHYAKKIFSEIDQPGKPIRLLGVSVSALRRASQEQFLLQEFERRRHLIQAVDQINDQFGEFTVKPATLNFHDDAKIASRALQLFGSGR